MTVYDSILAELRAIRVSVQRLEWTPYGLAVFTGHLPDGTTVVNPDPSITVAVNNLVNPLYRITYSTNTLAVGRPVIP